MDLSSLTPDKQVKLQYWLDVIRQCRASGLTNQIWCEQHDISLKSYYYWLSKIRKLALEELPRKKNGIHMCTDQQSTALTESPAEFAELSLPRSLCPTHGIRGTVRTILQTHTRILNTQKPFLTLMPLLHILCIYIFHYSESNGKSHFSLIIRVFKQLVFLRI